MTDSAPTPAPAPAPVPPAAPAARWNVLSIVSLVTSIVGLSLVGIITGHISLSQIKKSGEEGRVLAIIGLVLGYLGLVAFVIVAIVWIGWIVAATSISVYN